MPTPTELGVEAASPAPVRLEARCPEMPKSLYWRTFHPPTRCVAPGDARSYPENGSVARWRQFRHRKRRLHSNSKFSGKTAIAPTEPTSEVGGGMIPGRRRWCAVSCHRGSRAGPAPCQQIGPAPFQLDGAVPRVKRLSAERTVGRTRPTTPDTSPACAGFQRPPLKQDNPPPGAGAGHQPPRSAGYRRCLSAASPPAPGAARGVDRRASALSTRERETDQPPTSRGSRRSTGRLPPPGSDLDYSAVCTPIATLDPLRSAGVQQLPPPGYAPATSTSCASESGRPLRLGKRRLLRNCARSARRTRIRIEERSGRSCAP